MSPLALILPDEVMLPNVCSELEYIPLGIPLNSLQDVTPLPEPAGPIGPVGPAGPGVAIVIVEGSVGLTDTAVPVLLFVIVRV